MKLREMSQWPNCASQQKGYASLKPAPFIWTQQTFRSVEGLPRGESLSQEGNLYYLSKSAVHILFHLNIYA